MIRHSSLVIRHLVVSTFRTRVGIMETPYDPDKTPNPEQGLATHEGEKTHLVERYHRKKRIRLPNARMHAVLHVVVENQVAMGDEIPVRATLLRLMREGLNRHDAVHAVATVLANHIFDLLKNKLRDADVNAAYYRELEKLTAEGWLKSFNEEEPEGEGS